jgi:hypothetical protein
MPVLKPVTVVVGELALPKEPVPNPGTTVHVPVAGPVKGVAAIVVALLGKQMV